MNLSTFFQSLAGMYLVQSFLHALIAVIVTDGALWAWKIDDPGVKQRFRFANVIFPVFSFPLFQLANPGRRSLHFRETALFDSGRWLGMDVYGFLPFLLAFLVLLAGTTLIFLAQELVPILRHIAERDQELPEGDDYDHTGMIDRAFRSLPVERPRVVIVDDNDLVLFSTTGKNAAVILSTGTLSSLSAEQIRAALAHEVAHISRSRRPLLLAAFLLRMIMFSNPVTLMEFRRAVRNEEKICDDMAVAMTGSAEALAQTLKKYYSSHAHSVDGPARQLSADVPITEYSHDLQLRSRIERLEQGVGPAADRAWIQFAVVMAATVTVCYFVI